MVTCQVQLALSVHWHVSLVGQWRWRQNTAAALVYCIVHILLWSSRSLSIVWPRSQHCSTVASSISLGRWHLSTYRCLALSVQCRSGQTSVFLMVHRRPTINFSTPCLSLKSFEQVSSHTAWRLIQKQGRQQQITSYRVPGLRGILWK